MAKRRSKLPIKRLPPKRTLNKQQALRHLIHAATRLIAAREDPFAIHILIQSADKLLIDLGKKTGKPLAFHWENFVKEEYKDALLAAHRETFNFFKHADRDHDQILHVGNITYMNVLILALCIANYHTLYGTWTDHMKVIFAMARIVFPKGFVPSDQELEFKTASVKLGDMTPTEFLADLWTDPIFQKMFPNLAAEKDEDLQDTFEFYNTNLSLISVR